MGWFDYCDHLITEAHTVSRVGAPRPLQLHAALCCLYLEDPGGSLGSWARPRISRLPSTCYVRLCARTQLFLSGKLLVVGKTHFKTCSLAPRWFRMPWQRLWLRSYLWKFCSPSSYTCKFYLVPSRCGYAPGEMLTPPSPFLCLRPGTSLASHGVSGLHWLVFPFTHLWPRAMWANQGLPPIRAKERGLRKEQPCHCLDFGLPVSRTIRKDISVIYPRAGTGHPGLGTKHCLELFEIGRAHV